MLPRLSRAAQRCLVSRSTESRQRSGRVLLQIHAIKLAIKPSKSNYHECVRGNSKEIFELFTNKLGFSMSVSQDEESDEDPDSPSPH